MNYILLIYIRLLANLQLWKYKALNKNFTVIGISGSAGKTSTMLAVYAILKDKYRCKYSYKANSETGIPLNILGLQIKDYTKLEWMKLLFLSLYKLITNWEIYDIYIVEMGVDSIKEPKNMKYLLKIVKPDIAIFLNVTATHFENYESSGITSKEDVINLIAADKSLLIKSLPKSGLAILNTDDPRVAASKELAICPVILLSSKDFKDKIEIPGHILPSHYQYTFNLALAICEYFKIDRKEAINNLVNNFHIEAGRCSLFEGINNSLIIDSSYNSSKEPLMDMIDLLNEQSLTNHSIRIAVLGDMRELGTASKSEHEDVAEYAFGKVDVFFLVGPCMKEYVIPKLESLGFNKDKIFWFDKTGDCASKLSLYLKEFNDTKIILVKGSQNTIFLELVVEKLLLHKEDIKYLCRRGAFWDRKRSHT